MTGTFEYVPRKVIVDPNGHLMGALGVVILAKKSNKCQEFDFAVEDMEFHTQETSCGQCPNQCEIICVFQGKKLIDSWGNRCERGANPKVS